MASDRAANFESTLESTSKNPPRLSQPTGQGQPRSAPHPPLDRWKWAQSPRALRRLNLPSPRGKVSRCQRRIQRWLRGIGPRARERCVGPLSQSIERCVGPLSQNSLLLSSSGSASHGTRRITHRQLGGTQNSQHQSQRTTVAPNRGRKKPPENQAPARTSWR